MNNICFISKKVYYDLVQGFVGYIISDNCFKYRDFIILEYNNEKKIKALITETRKFNKIEDVFKFFPLCYFGKFNNVNEATSSYEYLNGKEIYTYRIKPEIIIETNIQDKNLLNLINEESLNENITGYSRSKVLNVALKDGRNAILKIQDKNEIAIECEKIKWLQGKINCPKIYYYNEIDNIGYLLIEKIDGIASFKSNDIDLGYKLGKELRKIHSLPLENCNFTERTTENMLNRFLKVIDIILPNILISYPEETKENILLFMKDNKPTDDAVVHGDYSLPNILINKNEIAFIDLGGLSRSTRYFDFYYFIKTLEHNKKMSQLDGFKKGYGIDTFDDKILKWMDLIDKSLI